MHTLKSNTDNTSIKVPILQTIVTTVFTFMLVLVKPPSAEDTTSATSSCYRDDAVEVVDKVDATVNEEVCQNE